MTDAAPQLVSQQTSAPKTRGERIFFPGLNLVRAYAALAVIVWHQQQFQKFYHVPIAEGLFNVLARIFVRGDDAVMLFFVLSGFLITYLLLAEHRRTGGIAIGKFYIRRILRIWPLYYLLVLLGFVVLPICLHVTHFPSGAHEQPVAPIHFHEPGYFQRLICYLLLIPNVSYFLWPGGIPIAHLWSIGVEEQFYLLWPALLKLFARWALVVILAVIAIKAGLYALGGYYQHATFNWRRGANPLALRHAFEIINLLRLDCMAIGGLGAYIAFHARGVVCDAIYHPLTALMVLAGFGYVVISEYRPPTPYMEMAVAGLYGAMILCAAGNPRLPAKWIPWSLDYLGRISYGIYMYHVPVIFCLFVALQNHHATWHTGDTITLVNHHLKYIAPSFASPWRNAALLALVIAITTVIATVSFYGFEKPFLGLKRRYTVVPSGSPDVAHV